MVKNYHYFFSRDNFDHGNNNHHYVEKYSVAHWLHELTMTFDLDPGDESGDYSVILGIREQGDGPLPIGVDNVTPGTNVARVNPDSSLRIMYAYAGRFNELQGTKRVFAEPRTLPMYIPGGWELMLFLQCTNPNVVRMTGSIYTAVSPPYFIKN